MSASLETSPSVGPRKLGLGCKLLLGLLALSTLPLGVGGWLAQRKRLEEDRRRQTAELVKKLAIDISGQVTAASSDLESFVAFVRQLQFYGQRGFAADNTATFSWTPDRKNALLDAWDNPILLSYPGHVHKAGFDVISCGPNGLYEDGGGDDIVAGQDLSLLDVESQLAAQDLASHSRPVASPKPSDPREGETLALLGRLARHVGHERALAPCRADGFDEPTGQSALARELNGDRHFTGKSARAKFAEWESMKRDWGGDRKVDAWGSPIFYRCPGPVHNNGWDLISCGPNGIYEEGRGDDIVVGEDVPGGIAAIQSEAR